MARLQNAVANRFQKIQCASAALFANRAAMRTLLGLAVIVLAVYSSVSSHATVFTPSLSVTLNPTTVSSNPDMTVQTDLPAPSSTLTDQFGGNVVLSPSALSIADAATIPNAGAYVGQMNGVFTMSLANDGCNSQLAISFGLVEANVATTALSLTPVLTATAAITPAATTISYSDPTPGTDADDPLGVRADGLAINEIQIDTEEMKISAVNLLANTYTVVRGWNGTVPAAHVSGAEIRRVGVIFPAGPATNLLANLAEDDGNLDNIGGIEVAQFAGNGVADGADALPSFVRDSLDPNGDADDGGYVQAHARYSGVAFVAGTAITILQYVIAAPGSLSAFPMQHLGWIPAGKYAMMTVMGNPLGPPSNTAISHFCNFISSANFFGVTHDNDCTRVGPPPLPCNFTGAGFTLRLAVDGGGPVGGAGSCPSPGTTPNECGALRATNPPVPTTLTFGHRFDSQRDFDGDGLENSLDVCPLVANTPVVDADGDGLAVPCDPNDAVINTDQDGDGWLNRLDNCPLVHNVGAGGGGGTVPNTFQFDQDQPVTGVVSDLGPSADSIGPACDPAPASANLQHWHSVFSDPHICIGAPTANCSTTLDSDNDAVVNAQDSCIFGANEPYTYPGPSGRDTLSAQVAAGATSITVGDVSGFLAGNKIIIGTGGTRETLRTISSITGNTINFSPALAFGHGTGEVVAQVSFAQSPRDLNNSGFSDTGDIGLLTGVFGSQQGRFDLNYDGFIDTGDITPMTGVFSAACP